MIDFIAKYWLEVLFGLICAAMAFLARHYVKLIKKDRDQHEKDIIESLHNELETQGNNMKIQMDECYARLISTIDERDKEFLAADERMNAEIEVIKDGILAIQGRAFKNECHRLLRATSITVNEYENLLAEHTIYNKLGGNHEGDALFSMVQAKYKGQLASGNLTGE